MVACMRFILISFSCAKVGLSYAWRAWLLLDRLLAVGGRGNASVFLEHAAEIRKFVESDRIADIGNGQFGLLQHRKGMKHAKIR